MFLFQDVVGESRVHDYPPLCTIIQDAVRYTWCRPYYSACIAVGVFRIIRREEVLPRSLKGTAKYRDTLCRM
jgi:hypothetical protein